VIVRVLVLFCRAYDVMLLTHQPAGRAPRH